ncbi:LicD family protein [Carboxylicivirga marina]|uniref:LicD family protein n=1 Tax=Carboxylicivirga marina TaxID=2800988 RepID=A0ABS1HP87_9BACT|nr:LicD family protein [Carboxylicivirga marina]MBK3519498.1 LicD family protein [Carboxylicivirga marina]
MSGTATLEGRKNKKAQKLLERVVSIADKCNLDYWLEGGTLLGIVRENRILPWDNDLDISVRDVSDKDIENFVKALKKDGLRLRMRLFTHDYSFAKTGDYRLLKIRTKFLWFIKGPVVLDVFFKKTEGNHVKWVINKTQKQVPSHFHDESTTITFNNYQYKTPKNYREYLTYRYGDWQVVRKDWDTYEHDSAIESRLE